MNPAEVLAAVIGRAEAVDWAGADPYDGLLSWAGRLAQPFGPIPRFAVSQIVLRSRLARALAAPPPTVNAKGLGLYLGALAHGRDTLGETHTRGLAASLVRRLSGSAIRSGEWAAWGYPFPWQSRSFWAPVGTPNAVVTATAAWHLLDAGDALGLGDAHAMAWQAGQFLMAGLTQTRIGKGVAISYTPRDQTCVVNVSALAARVLARLGSTWDDPRLIARAAELLAFVLSSQKTNGSWPYALDEGGDWEDSFHTGFVLEALLDVSEWGVPLEGDALERGFGAYERYFGMDGSARLQPRRPSVLDAHSAAQGILTYAAASRSEVIDSDGREEAKAQALAVTRWALDELWMEDRGHFAYRVVGNRRDERDFARWVQAWMALAMAHAAALARPVAVVEEPAVPEPGPSSPPAAPEQAEAASR
jgi:hypothetical protein